MIISMSYTSPFSSRYLDSDMAEIFSDGYKYYQWRKLWLILAQEEKELGAPISQEQIDEIEEHLSELDLERAAEIEKQTRHDVVAHLQLLGEQCPKAKPILHLGVTSCYITDNADAVIMYTAMAKIYHRLTDLINELKAFAGTYAGLETVAYTHFQVAQPTTIGKRACLWLRDFDEDRDELLHQSINFKTLGCKGATGNMSGTICLFDGDVEKARTLDARICKRLNLQSAPITSQTYSRKQDFRVLQVLSQIAQSASKFATDIRLLSNTGEIHEGFGEKQVGSSAMPYKKNPITCEKITSLSRFVIVNLQNAAFTAASQWLERTLDDSANRRVIIAEMFLATAEILNSCISVVQGLTVDKEKIDANLGDNIDKFYSEIMMTEGAKHGADRQELHELLREKYTNRDHVAKDDYVFSDIRLSGSAEDDVKQFLERI